jgi:hypothetical protein
MWWEPRNGPEEDLRQEVERLLGSYREHLSERPSEPIVLGVGSGPGEDGVWRPLLLVSFEALRVTRSTLPFGRMFLGAMRSLVGERNDVMSLLATWDARPGTFVDVTTHPVAAASVRPGDHVQERTPGLRFGRVGLPVWIERTGRDAFLTAGHLVGGNGAPVEVVIGSR